MDAAVQTKFLEIECSLLNLDRELLAEGIALDASEKVLASARLKHRAAMTRIEDVSKEISVLKEMLSVKWEMMS